MYWIYKEIQTYDLANRATLKIPGKWKCDNDMHDGFKLIWLIASQKKKTQLNPVPLQKNKEHNNNIFFLK